MKDPDFGERPVTAIGGCGSCSDLKCGPRTSSEYAGMSTVQNSPSMANGPFWVQTAVMMSSDSPATASSSMRWLASGGCSS
jgi:hypothetical protein